MLQTDYAIWMISEGNKRGTFAAKVKNNSEIDQAAAGNYKCLDMRCMRKISGSRVKVDGSTRLY